MIATVHPTPMPLRWLVLLAGLTLLVQMPLYAGYVTDDSFIYARFAENLARHGELSFNVGEPVHAATSPLWAALGAIGVMIGAGAYATLHAAGMLFGAAACALLARAVLRLGLPAPVTIVAVLVIATEPWLVRWSASAMETSLGVFLLAVVLDASLRPVGSVRWGRAAWAAGLLPLVRPECILLLGLFGVHVLRTPSARRCIGVWIGASTPMVLWAALALTTYGHVFPATLQAKSTPLGLQPERLVHNVKVLAALYALAAALPVTVWLLSLRPRRLWGADPAIWSAPALWQWSVVLPLVYLVRDVQVVSRYLEMVLPVVIVLALHAGRGFFARKWGRRLLVVQAVVAVGFTVGWSAPSARAFGHSLSTGLGDIASWLRENSEPDALVAIYDIGLVGARSDRRILDLGGLVHPGINELRNRVDDAVIQHEGLFLQFGRPDFFVDRDARAGVLDGATLGDVRLQAVLAREVANLGLSRPEPVVYTLYRVLDAGPAPR